MRLKCSKCGKGTSALLSPNWVCEECWKQDKELVAMYPPVKRETKEKK